MPLIARNMFRVARLGRSLGMKGQSSFRRFQRSEEVIPAEVLATLASGGGGGVGPVAIGAGPNFDQYLTSGSSSSSTHQHQHEEYYRDVRCMPERPQLHKQWSRESATDESANQQGVHLEQAQEYSDADRASVHESLVSEHSFA